MMKVRFILIGLFTFHFLIFFWSCTNSTNADKCPLGQPTPIYSSDYNFINSHEFSVEGQQSEEKIFFANNRQLTIRQSGCESVKQSYEFLIPGNLLNKADSFWLNRSVEEFLLLGNFEEKFYAYKLWANKIQEHKPHFKLTEPFEAESGIFIKIDRIVSTEQAILKIDLYQN